MITSVTIVIPAKNEAAALARLLPDLAAKYPEYEILVVDDGSTDNTAEVSRRHGAKVITHRYNMGNGAAVKTGARHASSEFLVFMDADGQHDPADISRLVEKLESGYDMAVGARQADTQASLARRFANTFYNRLASFMTGYRIEDLTSGFRAARAPLFRRFLYLLPNKFSYPTTSTMAFFRSGFAVGYVPIRARQRHGQGKSHIKPLRDGTRFLIIILKIGALFSPMRLFLPISAALFSTGVFYYIYTYLSIGRFTNMSALLFLSSVFTFLIGILSEQISALHYKEAEVNERNVGSRDYKQNIK